MTGGAVPAGWLAAEIYAHNCRVARSRGRRLLSPQCTRVSGRNATPAPLARARELAWRICGKGVGGRRRGHFCSTNNYFDRINCASLGDGFRKGEGRQRIRERVCEEGGALKATEGMSRILERYTQRKMGKRQTVC